MASRVPILGAGDKLDRKHLPAASTTEVGAARRATPTEQATGADVAAFVDPAGLLAAIDAERIGAALAERIQDVVGAMLVSGGSLTLNYNDAAGTITITGSGGDAETIRDTIGAAMVGVNGVTVAVNDAADTITLGISGLTVSQVTGLQAALDAKLGTSTFAAYGIRPTIYVNSDGTWPPRTVPAGYTGRVTADAADHPTSVAAPSWLAEGDRLIRRKAT